jgi:hypothetical protein
MPKHFIPKFTGEIKNGKLEIENKRMMALHIRSLEGQKVSVVISKLTKTRSLAQNALYWLYLHLLEDETGNEASDMHEYFKTRFLPHRTKRLFGALVRLPPTTTSLDKLGFSDYLAKIEQLTGIPIPDTQNINV